MERNLYPKLVEWKNKSRRKPLILLGARQVGKTWLLKEFGRREYRNLVYFNCEKEDASAGKTRNDEQGKSIVEDIFSSKDPHRIINRLSIHLDMDIDPEKDFIFLDEIQDYPDALLSLKYFKEDAPEYHVAAAGSLLGLQIHEDKGFPVGMMDIMDLYPMTFDEFLKAMGKDRLIESLETDPLADCNAYLHKLEELLRQYYWVGGMPEAVAEFVDTGDYREVRNIQKNILKGYEFDIGKHAEASEVLRIKEVLNSIPAQLAKENKKFVYGVIKGGARARTYENAINWLIDAGILYQVFRCNVLERPLSSSEDHSAFKLYMLDLGLLGAISNTEPSDVLVRSDSLFSSYRGAFTEQYVAEQFAAIVGPDRLYYHTNQNSTAEIDFISEKGAVLAFEVKAETNLRAKSLSAALKKYPELKGYRYSMAPYRMEERMECVPLSAVPFHLRRVFGDSRSLSVLVLPSQ